MATSDKTPYELLGVPVNIKYNKLRTIYRKLIHEHKQNNISAADFRCKVRAYETLSYSKKRERYDSSKEWISELPLTDYTVQQLAAEPDLILNLQDRIRDADLTKINAQDDLTGHTALYCAARSGNINAVIFLTEQGAESDLSQCTKSTALHAAAFYGHADVIRYLLESGADYRIPNESSNTAEDEAYDEDVRQVFTELKEMPYVRTAVDQIDWFLNNTLEQHIDEQYYIQRQTLLHCASKKGYFELVRLFVEQLHTKLNIVDVNRNSALHLAAYGGHATIVEYLLNQGCDSTLQNRWGTTAEEEGSKHGHRIIDIFQHMREKDIFEMARNGIDWWFNYYFNDKSPDTTDSKGTSLLYHACRHGQLSVAKWLLEHGANVNIQMKETPRSTSLQGAKYHGHLSIVELLLEYGGDVTIKNDFKATVFEEGVCDEVDRDILSKINQVLLQYRTNVKSHRLIDVHIYLDEDNDDKPKTKVQLHHAAVYDDLMQALPNNLRNEHDHFSIARYPLSFEKKETTIISAVCRARYASSKFIDTPLRLTLHRRPPNGNNSPRAIRQDPKFDSRSFQKQFQTQGQVTHFSLNVPLKDKQKMNIGDLTFTFSENCIKGNIKFEVRTLFSPDFQTFGLPGCICLFEASLYEDTPKLIELPLVSIADQPYARLYTLATPTPYWFSCDTRRTRLPMLDGIYAFMQHVSVIPILLTLPADMVIAAAIGRPLIVRQNPVPCTCLVLQEHDTINFPKIAYHGTDIVIVRSILTDGLVLPGTLVACGKRIRPPDNHIARGRKALGVPDFANAIFLSPSVHYSADPAYAVSFSYGDRQLLPVLECSVKRNSYNPFRCTVPTYIAHPGDNMDAIEWRVLDPANIVVNAVLLIPTIDSLGVTVRERITKITSSSGST